MTNWYRFPDRINLAPKTAGVYLLGNQGEGVIYAGRADSIRDRLLQHPDPTNPCLQRKQITLFAYEENPNSEDRERELINRYNPECNRE